MARNSSGTMSAPASYPPVPASVISLDDYKALVQDIINELTDSLSRNGKGGMLAALKLADGTVSLPGLSFTAEPGTGLYRYGAGDLRLAILGAAVAKVLATGLEVTGTVKASGGLADDPSHGNRGGGALHSNATAGTAGFMSAADKLLLDGADSVATANALAQRDAGGRAAFAPPVQAYDAANKEWVEAQIAAIPKPDVRRISVGSVTNTGRTFTLALNPAEPDVNYTVIVTPHGQTGTPDVAAFTVSQVDRATNQIVVTTLGAPGTGSSVIFDVALVR